MTDAHDDTLAVVPNQGWDERIVVVRCGTLVDVFVVVSARYVVLVDTLFSPASASALLDIARPYLVDGRQLLVVNSHADWDHAWGNQIFTGDDAAFPAPVIGSRRCGERLRGAQDAQQLAEKQASEPARFADVRLAPPSIVFDGRMAIHGGDLTLELFPTPGHAPDHIAVYIPEIRTLLAGDAAESPFPLVYSPTNLPVLRDSLALMQALRPETALYCHAPETSGPQVIQSNLQYFDELELRCRTALARSGGTLPDDDADMEEFAGFPLAEALPPGRTLGDQTDFYHTAHKRAVRVMLQYVAEQSPLRA